VHACKFSLERGCKALYSAPPRLKKREKKFELDVPGPNLNCLEHPQCILLANPGAGKRDTGQQQSRH